MELGKPLREITLEPKELPIPSPMPPLPTPAPVQEPVPA
jgi:hypothetical protein